MPIDTTRVADWDSYIGQERLKARLRVHINAAIDGIRPLEHVLLAAGPGMGKTALATCIAQEMHAPEFVELTMPCSEKDIANIVMDADVQGKYLILFLDEIHDAKRAQQEFLLALLERGRIQQRGRSYECANFTIVAATTEADKLQRTLFDRFHIVPAFDNYTDDEVARILIGMTHMLKTEMPEETAERLAAATGGTPRHARTFAIAARDLGATLLRPATADEVLEFCRVDPDGLTFDHMKYLQTLQLMGGQCGLANLRSVLRLPESSVRDLENLLLRLDLVELTSSGRFLLPGGARKVREAEQKEAAIA